MNPSDLSARLRSVADRIDRSARPSRSAVAAEIKDVFISLSRVSSGPTKIIVCESWTEDEARAAAKQFGAVSIGQGPFDGSFGIEVPVANVDGCVASVPGDGTSEERSIHVLDSWDDISGGDPEYAFEMLSL